MLAGFDPPLDGPMVLFDQVVEVSADAVPTGFVRNPVAFELRDRGRVSAVAIGVDEPVAGVIRSAQGLGQKAAGGIRVLLG